MSSDAIRYRQPRPQTHPSTHPSSPLPPTQPSDRRPHPSQSTHPPTDLFGSFLGPAKVPFSRHFFCLHGELEKRHTTNKTRQKRHLIRVLRNHSDRNDYEYDTSACVGVLSTAESSARTQLALQCAGMTRSCCVRLRTPPCFRDSTDIFT